MVNDKLSTQPYKGTRDFYPDDMKLRNWFFSKIRNVLSLNAYDEYNGPMLEPLELYAAKSGRELASEQTYNFVDRGGRELAIRPEMTPTVARMVAARINELNLPLKWFSIPNLYRYERPQRGRLREHWQVNADIFGCDSIEADLEIIYLAISLLKEFGADETMFKVHINNRRFFNEIMAINFNLDENSIIAISKAIDKKNKISTEDYIKELMELGLSIIEIENINSLLSMNIADVISQYNQTVGALELQELFKSAKEIGIEKYCVFDFSIMRGLDYYTGTVFEVFDEAPQNRRALFGGGRYDNLVSLFNKSSNITGVGFGFGDVTLENFLYTHSLIPNEYATKLKVLISRFPDIPYKNYSIYADILRNAGIISSIYLENKKIGKQIDYAIKENYSHMLIIGETEFNKGTIKIKSLAFNEETEIPSEELVDYFSSYIQN